MKSLLVLQVNGVDQPGLFTRLCRFLADVQINIVEVSQNVLRGYLSITFLLDPSKATINRDRFELSINKLGREHGLVTAVFPYNEGYRPQLKHLYIFSIMGIDQIGILADIAAILANSNINIETIATKVRSGWIYNQFILDIPEEINVPEVRNQLRRLCEAKGFSMVLQKEEIYRKNKKLIAFDMDSTLVVGETIVEVAKKVNQEEIMYQETEKAMNSDISFKDSLISRAKLLKGIAEDKLIEVANDLIVTPGAEELIHQLKEMGWKIALVSSGFSYFTDAVKERLGLDYSFGNTLEVKDGVVTGSVSGDIIDGIAKWEIIHELGHQLGISNDEIVCVGDGSNDTVMLKNSGLGIGLNSKEIASEVADGRVGSAEMINILLMLGLSETQIDKFLYKD